MRFQRRRCLQKLLLILIINVILGHLIRTLWNKYITCNSLEYKLKRHYSLNMNSYFFKNYAANMSEMYNFINIKNNKKKKNRFNVLAYNRFIPLIFIVGTPQSRSDYVGQIINENIAQYNRINANGKLIHCHNYNQVFSHFLQTIKKWTFNQNERERLNLAGVSKEIIDEAVVNFVLSKFNRLVIP
jgi:hypothetical protein